MWKRILENEQQIGLLKKEAISWAMCNGLVVSSALYDKNSNSFTHAPFTLLPSLTILKSEYLKLKSVSLIFHKLLDAVSRDPDFLIQCLSSAARSDPNFLGKLLEIYKIILKSNTKQPYHFGVFRNDFMNSDNKWIQIEINTIASAGSLMSDKTSKLHSYLIRKYNLKYNNNNNTLKYPLINDNNLGLAKSLYVACRTLHEIYLNGKYSSISERTVLFIVSDDEVNLSDQKGIEYILLTKYNIKTLRRSLLYVSRNGKLNESNGEFYVDNKFICCCYFRSGYSPNHYINGNHEWNARLMIEQSIAIKCPCIQYQLIGSKLMQIIFTDKNILKKYLNDNEIDNIYQHFGMIKFLNNIDINLLNDIKNNPQKYVLKHTQREGGGNNLYDNDIVDFLNNKMNNKNVHNWIVMERLYPKPMKTFQIRNLKQFDVTGISEFGIYSAYIGNGKGDIQLNDINGTLVRTKPHDVAQGGVFSGFAVFDSVMLIDDNKQFIRSSL